MSITYNGDEPKPPTRQGVICPCGYVHVLNRLKGRSNPAICHLCYRSLWWKGDKAYAKRPEETILVEIKQVELIA